MPQKLLSPLLSLLQHYNIYNHPCLIVRFNVFRLRCGLLTGANVTHTTLSYTAARYNVWRLPTRVSLSHRLTTYPRCQCRLRFRHVWDLEALPSNRCLPRHPRALYGSCMVPLHAFAATEHAKRMFQAPSAPLSSVLPASPLSAPPLKSLQAPLLVPIHAPLSATIQASPQAPLLASLQEPLQTPLHMTSLDLGGASTIRSTLYHGSILRGASSQSRHCFPFRPSREYRLDSP